MVRIDQRPYLAQVPEAAPHAVGVEEMPGWLSVTVQRKLSDATIVQRIGSIDIAGNSPACKDMIQPGVKLA